ncbi:50S ribosomal protein L17 [Geomesophilobacter sediminis]|uniref:Large ribosomal subunit protein bL17 n=1 Tax=Geomesophilobacter sediminis TaxID=2798584 RepID=A0A8J7JET2_9BACT|nr:50S ribosomal protein L17 [Geomesophilobacter sediminis]MBJ6725826.1 50S ribosomal protein L17 [Geomesophilobacter sediminis]
MRHGNAGRRLGRTTSHRIAMFRNMVTSFLEHGRITTTDAKAKELRSIAEKMITLGKKGDLHATRQAAAYIRDKKVVTKLFTTIAPKYADRPGGYTRIIKLGIRPGDTAPVSIIELVEEEMKPKKAAAKPAKKAVKAAPAAPAAPEPVVVEAAPAAEAAPVEAPAEEKTEE